MGCRVKVPRPPMRPTQSYPPGPRVGAAFPSFDTLDPEVCLFIKSCILLRVIYENVRDSRPKRTLVSGSATPYPPPLLPDCRHGTRVCPKCVRATQKRRAGTQ